jgi:hypothetical protein
LTWALDLHAQPLFYVDPIDKDPVFEALRLDPRLKSWRERIRLDNGRQLEKLKTLDASGRAESAQSNS